MSDRSALVLGASGVVGMPLCQSIINEGWQVFGAARFGDAAKKQQLEAMGVETVVFDLTQEDAGVLPDVDVVFLEVWDRNQYSADDQTQAVYHLNYTSIGRVVARYAGKADIVNGSTITLYGPRGDRPSIETDSPRPHNDYAIARHAQELLIDFLCHEAGSRAVHLRYCRSNTANFGVIRHAADAVLAGRSLGTNPDEHTQVISLDDFVRCTVQAALHIDDMPGAVNIVHPTIWTNRSLAQELQKRMGKGEVVFSRETGGAEHSVWADPALMIQTFGTPTVDLDRLIDDVCDAALAADAS